MCRRCISTGSCGSRQYLGERSSSAGSYGANLSLTEQRRFHDAVMHLWNLRAPLPSCCSTHVEPDRFWRCSLVLLVLPQQAAGCTLHELNHCALMQIRWLRQTLQTAAKADALHLLDINVHLTRAMSRSQSYISLQKAGSICLQCLSSTICKLLVQYISSETRASLVRLPQMKCMCTHDCYAGCRNSSSCSCIHCAACSGCMFHCLEVY